MAGGGIDTVDTDGEGYVLGANVENLTLVGVPTISGTGNGLANVADWEFRRATCCPARPATTRWTGPAATTR